MPIAAELANPAPLVEMNTAPLIDVLLVLLVMFIITIPIQSHAVKFELPQPCASCLEVQPVKNEVAIERSGQIRWNGTPVTQVELRSVLAQSQRLRPVPELHLRPAPDARYEAVDEVLGIIKREHVQRFGFVGNEAYATYE
jgi:biopolymer transport protein ExbD